MMGEQRDRAYGKGARMLLANLAACRDVVIGATGLRPGAELRPWAPCPGRLATTPAEAIGTRCAGSHAHGPHGALPGPSIRPILKPPAGPQAQHPIISM